MFGSRGVDVKYSLAQILGDLRQEGLTVVDADLTLSSVAWHNRDNTV